MPSLMRKVVLLQWFFDVSPSGTKFAAIPRFSSNWEMYLSCRGGITKLLLFNGLNKMVCVKRRWRTADGVKCRL